MSKVAIVTGSNSGLGFEACRQLALRDDFGTIFMAARTQEKADKAKTELVEKHEIKEEKLKTLVVDVSSIQKTKEAVEKFMTDNPNMKVDLLVANAGRVGGKSLETTEEGYNVVYAASLFGHYIMTVKFLKNSVMAENSTVVFSGSELARGRVPGLTVADTDFTEFAKEHFEGDISKGMICSAKGDTPAKYDGMGCYGDTKRLSNWVVGALARTEAAKTQKVKIFCVSPGNTPGTNAQGNLSGIQKFTMPILVFFMKLFKMSHTLDKGAGRYIEAMEFDEADSGKFFASADGKLQGPLADNTAFHPEFLDTELQDAAMNTLKSITEESTE